MSLQVIRSHWPNTVVFHRVNPSLPILIVPEIINLLVDLIVMPALSMLVAMGKAESVVLVGKGGEPVVGGTSVKLVVVGVSPVDDGGGGFTGNDQIPGPICMCCMRCNDRCAYLIAKAIVEMSSGTRSLVLLDAQQANRFHSRDVQRSGINDFWLRKTNTTEHHTSGGRK